MQLRADISQTEFLLYVIVWISSAFYSIYSFAVSCNQNFQHYEDYFGDFEEGWSFLSRRKDAVDPELRLLKFAFTKACYWVICSAVVSELIRQIGYSKILQNWQLLISVGFILKVFGIYGLGIILWQPFYFSIIVLFTRKKGVIWIGSIFALIINVLLKFYITEQEFIKILQQDELTIHGLINIIFWMNLRCVSYTTDSIDNHQFHKKIQFLSYCLYLPTLLGPFIPFQDFSQCYENKSDLRKRCINLILKMIRFSFWAIFIDFILHFIYVNAIGLHPEWVAKFNSWSLYGYGYTMGQYFHIKYVVLYGFPCSFAEFDNIQAPPTPVCIGRIHLYSDMWKYFDVGLHNFIVRYIYIPINSVIKNQLFSILVAFTFIYVWHGPYYFVFLWASLNMLGVFIERFSQWIYDEYLKNSVILKKVGEKWFRRITCLAASPLLLMSCISNFYFFAGEAIGDIFASRCFIDSFLSNTILFFIIHTICQVSTELRSRLKSSTKEKAS